VTLLPGYREVPPPPALRGALACLWVRVAGPPGWDVRVLPDGCADLIWHAGEGAFVAGPDTGPVLAAAPARAVFVGARFAPGAGGPALGRPLEALRDARVAVADLAPRLAARLPGSLEPDAALRELTLVAAELVAAGPPDPAVRAAAGRLGAEPATRVDVLADDLGLSERQLRRRCRAAAGYGPKTLGRVLRFRRYLALSDAQGPDADLAGLAWEAGYADQPHLTRECTRLTGLTPAALALARRAEAAAAGDGPATPVQQKGAGSGVPGGGSRTPV
jgi:AraC-like DNA-binding protein